MATPLADRAAAQVAALRDPARRRVLVREVSRFGAVGAAGFVLDTAVFNALLHEHVGVLTSKGISTVLAALFTYVLNRWWSFAHRERGEHRRDLPLFLLLSAIGLAIAEACLATSHYGLGYTSRTADNISGIGLGTVLGTIWRFYSFKRWVFTAPGTRTPEVLVVSVQ